MENNKEQISEGLLTNIVDNFFKSLQKGVGTRYIAAAQKAGVHPEVAKQMKKLELKRNIKLKQKMVINML